MIAVPSSRFTRKGICDTKKERGDSRNLEKYLSYTYKWPAASPEHFNLSSAMCPRKLPTFLYVMPFSKTRIFVEETSLVARPAIGFDELKQRLDRRLQHLGVRIKAVEEEEFCLIPMGGTLPKLPQRVLGIGGTGGMVHPSTGWNVSVQQYYCPFLEIDLHTGILYLIVGKECQAL